MLFFLRMFGFHRTHCHIASIQAPGINRDKRCCPYSSALVQYVACAGMICLTEVHVRTDSAGHSRAASANLAEGYHLLSFNLSTDFGLLLFEFCFNYCMRLEWAPTSDSKQAIRLEKKRNHIMSAYTKGSLPLTAKCDRTPAAAHC